MNKLNMLKNTFPIDLGGFNAPFNNKILKDSDDNVCPTIFYL
jgi:hypothetical protein